jgi:hypothetical protein
MILSASWRAAAQSPASNADRQQVTDALETIADARTSARLWEPAQLV